jgi:hypothetical protein
MEVQPRAVEVEEGEVTERVLVAQAQRLTVEALGARHVPDMERDLPEGAKSEVACGRHGTHDSVRARYGTGC